MWLFKLFQRDDRWTLPELEASLRAELGRPDYEILRNESSVAIRIKEQLVAYIELTDDGRRAVLFYEYTLIPYYAAKIALVLNDLLPVSLQGSMFEARRVDEVEPAQGIH